MNQIMEALQNPSVKIIGLCGPGGVGKTTIAREVATNQKMFNKVIMATVSQELNIENIQGQIAEKLGMQLKVHDKDVRASHLRERLKKERNMFLILDDLWEQLHLGEVGIPFLDAENDSKDNEGCKILLTSRNKALLLDLMKCQKIVQVGVLSEDEALELFKRTVELFTNSSRSDLMPITTEIVQKCGGLPLAIATTGKALRNKDLNEFEDALTQLNNPLRRNNTLTREVDNILTMSYDHLSSLEYKHIFLLAAMLPHDLSIEDLLMYSMGLDILDGIENMEQAHIGISVIVSTLKSLNLFLDSFSSHHVTIHDVFRDVALSIASSELHAFIRRRLKEWPDENMLEGCKGICLQESDICDLPEELHGQRLKFFMLNSRKHDLNIPSTFFKSSKELKVLAFTHVHFSSLPSLIFLQKLKALCLHSCLLEDIIEVRTLRNLKVFSLAYSEIEQLPIEVAELTSLQMLNLSHCSKLKVIPHKLLSSLKKLEVLYMGNSFDQWKVEGSSEAHENASLDELKDLPISSLDIHIPNVSMVSENLFLGMNLKRYRIFIGKHWKWQGNYDTTKILRLELESSIHLTCGIRKLLEGVEDLCLYGSNGHENVLYSHDGRGFPLLRHLEIESNDDIKYIVLNSTHHEAAFPILESLKLQNLNALQKLCEGPDVIVFHQLHTLEMINLPALVGELCIKDRATNNTSNKIFKSLFNKVLFPKLEVLKLWYLNPLIPLIWDDQLSPNSFSKLRTLTVGSCGFVKLWPLHVLKYLNNLEELEVRDCDMLEIVFDFEDFNDYKEMESSSMVVPLKKLELWNLPKLKNISSCESLTSLHAPTGDLYIKNGATNNKCNKIFKSLFNNKVLFPKLEVLELWYLNPLIPLIWDDQLSCNSFSKLRTLTVGSCGFVKLLPLHVLKYLNNLEELEVRDCDMLEIVFDFEDLNDCKEMESSSVVVPLKVLELQNLPKLKNVCSIHCQGNFPNLRSMCIASCNSLTSLHALTGDLYIKDGATNNKCNKIFKSLFNEVSLPKLEILELSNLLSNVISLIWDDQLLHNSFSNLKILVVKSCGFLKMVPLPVLKSFNNLEKLEVSHCDMLEMVFGFEDLNDYKEMKSSSVVVPLNLTHLEVNWCNELTTLMTSSFARSLVHLTHFSISHCYQIEEIITKQEGEDDEDKEIFFEKLELLKLDDMPILKRFCGYNYNFRLPLLNQLIIIRCPNFKIFSQGLIDTPSLKSVQLSQDYSGKHCEIWDTNLNKTLYQQRLLASRELVLDECDVNMIMNDQFPAETCPQVDRYEPYKDIWKSNQLYLEVKKATTSSHRSLWNSFLNLEDLELEGDFEEPFRGDDHAALAAPFSKSTLTHLVVVRCHGLTTLMTLSIAQSLVHLTHLSIGHCPQLEEIIMKQKVENDEDKEIFFSRLEFLELNHLPRLKRFCSYNYTFGFPLLECAIIKYCPQLTIFCLGTIYTPQLQSIQYNYQKIWDTNLNETIFHGQRSVQPREMVLDEDDVCIMRNDQFPADPYSGVEILRITSIVDKGITFPFTLLTRFPLLNALFVQDSSFENIFLSHEHIVDPMGKIPPFEKLYLDNLDQLKNIWKDDSQLPLVHQNLTYLQIKSCCNLVELAPSSTSFQNLRELSVSGCHKLIHLVSSSTAKSLVSLKELRIDHCKKMKEIVMNETNEDVEGGITFNQLWTIKLIDMPSLKMFSLQTHTFKFLKLIEIQIIGCPKMKMFCQGVLETPKLFKVKIEEHDMEWKDKGDLNKTMEMLSPAKDSIII